MLEMESKLDAMPLFNSSGTTLALSRVGESIHAARGAPLSASKSETFDFVSDVNLKDPMFQELWKLWQGPKFSNEKPASCNHLIGNLSGQVALANTQQFGALILPATLKCCYLHNDSLSGSDVIGPGPGSRTCLLVVT